MATTSRIGARLIDPRGQRFGAGFSAIVLVIAVVLQSAVLVALVALALGVSSLTGTRNFVFGRPWPTVRRLLQLGPPAYQEPEFGPRFAQALGFAFLALGDVLVAAGRRRSAGCPSWPWSACRRCWR